MKRMIWLAAALLATTPALAWDLNSEDTKKSWSYVAFQADKLDAVELQFYCDNEYPGDIQMLVFTDQDARKGDEDFPDVTVTAVVDDDVFADLIGYYDDVDGERTVVIDSPEEARLREFIATARDAKQPIHISYDGRSHRFATDNIVPVLDSFVEGCSR